MIDFLRIFLIILFSLSVLLTARLYVLEIIYYGFTIGGLLITIILCITHISRNLLKFIFCFDTLDFFFTRKIKFNVSSHSMVKMKLENINRQMFIFPQYKN
jgi:hypothetical protein